MKIKIAYDDGTEDELLVQSLLPTRVRVAFEEHFGESPMGLMKVQQLLVTNPETGEQTLRDDVDLKGLRPDTAMAFVAWKHLQRKKRGEVPTFDEFKDSLEEIAIQETDGANPTSPLPGQ